VNESAQLRAGVHQRAAGNGSNLVDNRRGDAGVKDRISDGTRGAEEKNLHKCFRALVRCSGIGVRFDQREINQALEHEPNQKDCQNHAESSGLYEGLHTCDYQHFSVSAP
jgi:hypothetical protein